MSLQLSSSAADEILKTSDSNKMLSRSLYFPFSYVNNGSLNDLPSPAF
jgi:hypothetical protein